MQIKAGDFFIKEIYNKKYNDCHCLLISNKFCLYSSEFRNLQIKRYDITEDQLWLMVGFLPIVCILSVKGHHLKIV